MQRTEQIHQRQEHKTDSSIRLPELLAPAGSFDHLKAAILAGADAVYIGGSRFGARAYAQNFSEETLTEALRYAHFYGRKVYLTVNTLMKDHEINDILYGFLQPYYEAGLDGVIVQDLGTASFIRENFPDMEVHASTQMTVTDAAGAQAAARLGMTRVVPARELSLEEVVRIKKESGLEVEVFAHGALCYCYSGQCLLSSMYGGRSGNRGQCAQPCRLPWHLAENTAEKSGRKDGQPGGGPEQHLLSPRDLCSIAELPALIRAGVDSLKIEGRMKNVEYVAGVTAIYRKYLDRYKALVDAGDTEASGYTVDEADRHALEELYSRGGFTDGYWHRHNGAEMMSVDCPRHLGRRIGTVRRIQKHQIELALLDTLHPGDILVLPLEGQEEIILTVPVDIGPGRQVMLNVPKAGQLRRGMAVYRRKNEELSRHIRENILEKERKYPVRLQAFLCPGQEMMVTLACEGETVTLSGAVVETAARRALTQADLERQLKKTGNVPFYVEELDITLEGDCFLPMSAVKNLRQQAFAQMKGVLESRGDRTALQETAGEKPKTGAKGAKSMAGDMDDISAKSKIAVVYDLAVLAACLAEPFFTGICLPLDHWEETDIREAVRQIQQNGRECYLSLPTVVREDASGWKEICHWPVWDGIYVHNINEAQILSSEEGISGRLLAGASFYQWNAASVRTTREMFGINVCQIPHELSARDYQSLLSAMEEEDGDRAISDGHPEWEWMVSGRIPVMVSAQCPKKTTGQCDGRPEQLAIEDDRGRRLPVTTHCARCYSKIWTEEPLDHKTQAWRAMCRYIDRYQFDFFLATPEQIARAKADFEQWIQKEVTAC